MTHRALDEGVKPPTKDVAISFTIEETTAGKLNIHASIPDHAGGTIALVLANAAMEVMREMMKRCNVPEESFTEQKRH